MNKFGLGFKKNTGLQINPVITTEMENPNKHNIFKNAKMLY